MKKSIFTWLLICTSFSSFSQQFGERNTLSYSSYYPIDIEKGDMDGDGHLDLIIGSNKDHKIAWCSNDGLGNFGFAQVVTLDAEFLQAIDITDLDEDGDLDILVAHRGSSSISWFENDGTGSFGQGLVISNQLSLATDIATADIDGDGDIDVLASEEGDSGGIYIFRNNGSEAFLFDGLVSSTRSSVNDIILEDINSDGQIDVLYTSTIDDWAAWVENDGTGYMVTEHILSDQIFEVNDLEYEDVTGDGSLDVVTCIPEQGKIILFESLGQGVFDEGQVISNEASQYITCLEIVDLNSDGLNDVMYGIDNSSNWFWLESAGNGLFEEYTGQGTGNGEADLIGGDFDEDGDIDIIASLINLGIYMYEQTSYPTLILNGLIANEHISPQAIFGMDVDMDSDMDVVVTGSSRMSWHERLSDGTYSNGTIIADAIIYFRFSISGDMDGDGDLDIVMCGPSIHCAENLGGGEFQVQEITDYGDSYTIALLDVNGDGNLDIVGHNRSQDELYYLVNNGGLAFSTPTIIASGIELSQAVVASDIDSDGDKDLVIIDQFQNRLTWMANNNDGTFLTPVVIAELILDITDAKCGDMDGDGDMDVVTASRGDHRFLWHENQGNGEDFQIHVIDCDAHRAYKVEIADFDNDGDLDVAGVQYFQDNVRWYENGGSGTFAAHTVREGGYNSAWIHAISAADMDSDGDKEILAGASVTNLAYWFDNLNESGCMDSGACNFDPNATSESDCFYNTCGCTDSEALNYNPWASYDDASCEYLMGCTVAGAENYNSAAYCDDGSCGFQALGRVFHDENENGIQDSSEVGLPLQEILLTPAYTQYITNNDGNFFVSTSGAVDYVFSLNLQPPYLFPTTSPVLEFNMYENNWNSEVVFGVTTDSVFYNSQSEIYTAFEGYPCDTLVEHMVCFRNTGIVPMQVVIALEYDSLFQGHSELNNIDSISGNTLYYSTDELNPGEMECWLALLLTPEADHLGETLTSSVTGWGVYSDSTVTLSTGELHVELTCAFDPNDKQVFPLGYTEDHFISDDQDLEFLIRFQNTGNAPATDVLILDTLDISLDIESFELKSNSHSVFTSLDLESRVVEFYFQDIQLPDSVNNEEESHGLVSYTIRPMSGVDLETEINNTAHIYFDNNSPIVTNTTWSTIYDCSFFDVSFTDLGTVLSAGEAEQYQWFLDGEIIDGATEDSYIALVNGNYSVSMSNAFPCDGQSEQVFILVTGLASLKKEDISLFPNPMSLRAIVNLGRAEPILHIEIVDLQGKLVRKETVSTQDGLIEIRRGALSRGAYILRINTNDESIELPFHVE